MSGVLVFLVAFTAGLAIRALWLSAVHHRQIGWVAAGSFAAGVVCVEALDSDWPVLAFLTVFVVSEFVVQTGAGPANRPPARWITRILPHLPSRSADHRRRGPDHDDR
jgi:hypothetical protein